MRFHRGGLALALMLAIVSARAEDAPDSAAPAATIKEALQRAQIQVFIENDNLAGSDRYYTNGFKVGGGAALPLLGNLLKPIPEAVLNVLGQAGPNGETPINHLGFFVGQNLYTPRDISIAANQPFDRPWAAWCNACAVTGSIPSSWISASSGRQRWVSRCSPAGIV